MEHMTDPELEQILTRTGRALQPDSARLRAALAKRQPVPSPLSIHTFTRAFGALALVIALLWVTTPAVHESEYQLFSAAIEADLQGQADALATFDAALTDELTPEDVFSDAFLDTVL